MCIVSELDELFGPVLPPQNGGVRHWESHASVKCYELNQASARDLSDFLALAMNGELGLQLMQAITMLWVVNNDGDVIFAMEQTIASEGTLRRPRMRGTPLGSSVKSLGHPLLVNGGSARISGELYIDDSEDPDSSDLTWILNNKSGRYGVHKTRKSEHLENVAALFRRYQVPVETDFMEGR